MHVRPRPPTRLRAGCPTSPFYAVLGFFREARRRLRTMHRAVQKDSDTSVPKRIQNARRNTAVTAANLTRAGTAATRVRCTHACVSRETACNVQYAGGPGAQPTLSEGGGRLERWGGGGQQSGRGQGKRARRGIGRHAGQPWHTPRPLALAPSTPPRPRAPTTQSRVPAKRSQEMGQSEKRSHAGGNGP
jgi:hypothetical protein